MARYILIDVASGYVWGYSADIDGKIATGTPCEIAQILDESIGETDGAAEYRETHQRDSARTYDVYRADINGSEAVPVVQDGQDEETCNAVVALCAYVTSVSRTI